MFKSFYNSLIQFLGLINKLSIIYGQPPEKIISETKANFMRLFEVNIVAENKAAIRESFDEYINNIAQANQGKQGKYVKQIRSTRNTTPKSPDYACDHTKEHPTISIAKHNPPRQLAISPPKLNVPKLNVPKLDVPEQLNAPKQQPISPPPQQIKKWQRSMQLK